jgi:putative nucleotidyltransferase with HDIG domain
VYAVELARKLGVGEGNQLKAIEAAALLHDMGKLAIPEHILNKPGKLSPAEFEKMKLHAAIGADLLSSVRFPYPVVPIVRHHHENWNGAGYPGGLAGTDIPLGARILSVVDCFDALTSDRPYRPALSDNEAFAILRERRGNMYDPLVVDTFIAVHGDIAASAKLAGEQARSLTASLPEGIVSTGAPAEPYLLDVDLRGFEEEIAVASSPHVLARLTEDEVARWLPVDLCVLYLYAPKHDRLEPYVADSAIDISEILIGTGERTSGWAVANGVTAANSPAALDLQHLAALFTPPLKLAVATPMKVGSDLVGALTVYSSSSDPYSGRHQSILEKIAASVAPRIRTLSSSIEPVRRAS